MLCLLLALALPLGHSNLYFTQPQPIQQIQPLPVYWFVTTWSPPSQSPNPSYMINTLYPSLMTSFAPLMSSAAPATGNVNGASFAAAYPAISSSLSSSLTTALATTSTATSSTPVSVAVPTSAADSAVMTAQEESDNNQGMAATTTSSAETTNSEMPLSLATTTGVGGGGTSTLSLTAGSLQSGWNSFASLLTQLGSLPVDSPSTPAAIPVFTKYYTINFRMGSLFDAYRVGTVELHYLVKYGGRAGPNPTLHLEMVQLTPGHWQSADVGVDGPLLKVATMLYSFTYTLLNPVRTISTTRVFRLDLSTNRTSVLADESWVTQPVKPIIPPTNKQPYVSLLREEWINGTRTYTMDWKSVDNMLNVNWIACYYIRNNGFQVSGLMERVSDHHYRKKLPLAGTDKFQFLFLYENATQSSQYITTWTTFGNVLAVTQGLNSSSFDLDFATATNSGQGLNFTTTGQVTKGTPTRYSTTTTTTATSSSSDQTFSVEGCGLSGMQYKAQITAGTFVSASAGSSKLTPVVGARQGTYHLTFTVVASDMPCTFVAVHYTRSGTKTFVHLSPESQTVWILDHFILDHTQTFEYYFVFGTASIKCQTALFTFSPLLVY